MVKEEQSSTTFIYLKVLSIGLLLLQKVIKTVQVDQYANLQDQSTKREQRYTVTPDPALLMQMMILDLMKLYLSFKMQRTEI